MPSFVTVLAGDVRAIALTLKPRQILALSFRNEGTTQLGVEAVEGRAKNSLIKQPWRHSDA
jgi:hypothetical protein